MQTALKFLQMTAVSFWVGSIFFFSFLAAPSIFKVLPRETAGNVVSDIFPKYYLAAYILGLIAIITSAVLWSSDQGRNNLMNGLRTGGLLLMLGLSIYAGQVVLPSASQARTEMRATAEESPNYPAIYEKFRKLHTQSAILNSAVFIMGIAILFINAYTNRE